MTFQVTSMNQEESDAWLGLITVCQVLPAVLDSQLQQDSQMTHFEYLVLSALRFSPDRTMRMTELATDTSSTLPRLSHVCSRLEKRGLVERFTCTEDRRATNVRLPRDGTRQLAAASPGHLKLVRQLVVDALTPEQLASLTEVTSVIRDRLADTSSRAARAVKGIQAS